MRYRFGGLIFGGAYTWRDLFSEFYGIVISRKCAKRATFNTFRTICYFCIALLVNYCVEINGSEASIECANACGGNGLRSERSFEKDKFLKKLIPCYGHPITIPKRMK